MGWNLSGDRIMQCTEACQLEIYNSRSKENFINSIYFESKCVSEHNLGSKIVLLCQIEKKMWWKYIIILGNWSQV